MGQLFSTAKLAQVCLVLLILPALCCKQRAQQQISFRFFRFVFLFIFSLLKTSTTTFLRVLLLSVVGRSEKVALPPRLN